MGRSNLCGGKFYGKYERKSSHHNHGRKTIRIVAIERGAEIN